MGKLRWMVYPMKLHRIISALSAKLRASLALLEANLTNHDRMLKRRLFNLSRINSS